jgi:murein DD-endopeptidase MepM/ murein hydrolase activator NlpD
MRDILRIVDERIKELEQELVDASRRIDEALAEGPEEPRPKTRFVWFLVKAAAALFLVLLALPPFYRPVSGSRSSSYFFRMRPESNLVTQIEFHKGVDFAAPAGTVVKPAGFGIVERTGRSESFGNYLVVRHLFGVRTLYAHLSRIDVGDGQLVIPGISQMAAVGSTGRATGPHLHLEFKIGDASLPPGAFLFFHNLRRLIVGF